MDRHGMDAKTPAAIVRVEVVQDGRVISRGTVPASQSPKRACTTLSASPRRSLISLSLQSVLVLFCRRSISRSQAGLFSDNSLSMRKV
jgi:hypothetical protein